MYRLILLGVAITVTAVWAQDPPAEDESATEPEAVEAPAEEELDDFEIDSQDYTDDDEDVFRPTDVVSFEQSVVFPVDI
jgi:hypothetical protein